MQPLSEVDPGLLGDVSVENVVSMTDLWKTYIIKVKQVFYSGAKEFRQQLTKYVIVVLNSSRTTKIGLQLFARKGSHAGVYGAYMHLLRRLLVIST